MEQTQENKTAGKKEISYPKFIQERLDRIPWEELEASYGIRKDYILGNEQVARQLASGQVTDYVRCYAKVGNLTVIGPMALQANFRNDRVEVKHFTVNPTPTSASTATPSAATRSRRGSWTRTSTPSRTTRGRRSARRPGTRSPTAAARSPSRVRTPTEANRRQDASCRSTGS